MMVEEEKKEPVKKQVTFSSQKRVTFSLEDDVSGGKRGLSKAGGICDMVDQRNEIDLIIDEEEMF